jgi:methyl-accepting chemotaxis protein
MNNLKISAKLYLLLFCFVGGFTLFWIVAQSTITTLSVNGDVYKKIVINKDLLADILPPPLSILESYLVVQQAVEAKPGELKVFKEQFSQLKKEYLDRRSYWQKELNDEKLKDLLLVKSFQIIDEFYSTAERDFFPALDAGDTRKAKELIETKLFRLYETHRQHIKEAAGIATAGNQAYEKIAGTRTWLLFIMGFIIITFTIALSMVIIRQLLGQLGADPREVLVVVRRVADGDLSSTDSDTSSSGSVLGSLRVMTANLRSMFTQLSGGVQTISSLATELSVVSRQLTASADGSSLRSQGVAAAAEEMSATMLSVSGAMEQATINVSSVASATEQMSATITEVANNSDKARRITGQAVLQADKVTAQILALGNAAREISKVTESITTISAQTNLLALNATIEAARAGIAGKGFTVVATEIKELAQQTAAATEGIREKIDNIQSSTAETVEEIEKISRVIQDVDGIIGTTAGAIEQQSLAIQDIAANIAQAAHGLQEVNENVAQSSGVADIIAKEIAETNRSVGEISTGSARVFASAEELSRLAINLELMAARFKTTSDTAQQGGSSIDKEQVEKAIRAHGMWKTRLQQAIETGKMEVAVSDVSVDNVCAFGKWFYGPSIPETVKHSPQYLQIKEMHAEFHKTAGKVADLALKNHKREAEQLMATNGEFSKISFKLTSALLSWKNSFS